MNTDNLALYYFPECPYCVRVLDAMKRLGLDIELRHTRKTANYQNEMVAATGKTMVPCLRIGGGQWMHESMDIVNYLDSNF